MFTISLPPSLSLCLLTLFSCLFLTPFSKATGISRIAIWEGGLGYTIRLEHGEEENILRLRLPSAVSLGLTVNLGCLRTGHCNNHKLFLDTTRSNVKDLGIFKDDGDTYFPQGVLSRETFVV